MTGSANLPCVFYPNLMPFGGRQEQLKMENHLETFK